MCQFKKINISAPLTFLENNTLCYIRNVEICFRKYFKNFQDDFSSYKNMSIIEIIRQLNPFFWIILDYKNKFMGFAFLDNFVGNDEILYSAELTTCFDKYAWGSFTRYSAKIFLKKCFDELGLQKIKAQIYPDNFRVKNLLKDAGFVYEATLKKETQRKGKVQDIEVYGLYRSYYYKNEVK